jgi:hypothetical protein
MNHESNSSKYPMLISDDIICSYLLKETVHQEAYLRGCVHLSYGDAGCNA